jgi:methanogenic corrinoid protein MtbC1
MHKSGLRRNVKERLLAFDRDGIRTAINKALDARVSPAKLMKELKEGLDEIGAKYEKGEYFLSELVITRSRKLLWMFSHPILEKVNRNWGRLS